MRTSTNAFCVFVDPPELLLRGHLRADAILLFPEFWCELVTEVCRLEHLAYLDLGVLKRRALEPFDRFIQRLHLPQPEACDQFFRLREGPIDHALLTVCEFNSHTFRRRVKSLSSQHYAGLR